MSLNASCHPTDTTRVTCWTYGTYAPPILTIKEPGQSDLSISVFPTEKLSVHRDFAQHLVETLTAYVAAVDEWAASQEAASTSAKVR
ncbi:hypothetical protein H9Y04_30375 [Streptomyces sp. TRM66268-LWL]|uniref:Uncharacterized protein n=1 Tax=Streptomyces polyasparticus TaxID=2767826 RepID=A0ABR7SPK4_9ACTN|nr:hypothetical protein [Streptomyces polyasparticus]MBC9716849.1 hypothetical protein [Streptomyces polyasparticus]